MSLLNFEAWWLLDDWLEGTSLGPADKVRSVLHATQARLGVGNSSIGSVKTFLMSAATPAALERTTNCREWDLTERVTGDGMASRLFHRDDTQVYNEGIALSRAASRPIYDDASTTVQYEPLPHDWDMSGGLSAAPGPTAPITKLVSAGRVMAKYNIEKYEPPKYRIDYWYSDLYAKYTRDPAKYMREYWNPPAYQVTKMEGLVSRAGPGTYQRYDRSVSTTGGPYNFTNTYVMSVAWRSTTTPPPEADVRAQVIGYISRVFPDYYFTGNFSYFYMSYYNSQSWRVFFRPEYYTAVFGPWTTGAVVYGYTTPYPTSTEKYTQLTSPSYSDVWAQLPTRPNGTAYLEYREYAPQTWLNDNNTIQGLWPGQQQRQVSNTGVWLYNGYVYAYSQPADTSTYRYTLVEYYDWVFYANVSIDNPPTDTDSEKYVFLEPGHWFTYNQVYSLLTYPTDGPTWRYILVEEGYWYYYSVTYTDNTPSDTISQRYVFVSPGYWNRNYSTTTERTYHLVVGGETFVVYGNNADLHYQPDDTFWHSYAYDGYTALGSHDTFGFGGLRHDTSVSDDYPIDCGFRQDAFDRAASGSAAAVPLGSGSFGILRTDGVYRYNVNTQTAVLLAGHSRSFTVVYRGVRYLTQTWFLVAGPEGLGVVEVDFATGYVGAVTGLRETHSAAPFHADLSLIGTSGRGAVIWIEDGEAWTAQLNFASPGLF